MKKILVLVFCLFALNIFSHAQTGDKTLKKTIVVPDAVSKSFSKDFSGVMAKWDKEDANYEANFKKDGKSMSAVYDNSGKLIETEESIAVTSLLQSVRDYVASHYKGKKIKEAAIITRPNGEINFEAEVDGIDLLFTKQGQFIKAIKD